MPNTRSFALALAAVAALSLIGCATDEIGPQSEPEPELEAAARTRVCTPGEQICDWGCAAQHGPSTDDCIVQCNAAGTGWITLVDCGWAQNFPFSSSCFDPPQGDPVCQWN